MKVLVVYLILYACWFYNEKLTEYGFLEYASVNIVALIFQML